MGGGEPRRESEDPRRTLGPLCFPTCKQRFHKCPQRAAFLLTPRDEFVLKRDIGRAYERDFHDIGWGVTISGPLVVSRMTSTIDVQMGEKVLEIGTGSGNQSAYLSNLTDKVWTIEIIKPLAERTRGIYDDLIGRGYAEYKSINTKNADGYYGWEEAAPFDKIIVTAASITFRRRCSASCARTESW